MLNRGIAARNGGGASAAGHGRGASPGHLAFPGLDEDE